MDSLPWSPSPRGAHCVALYVRRLAFGATEDGVKNAAWQRQKETRIHSVRSPLFLEYHSHAQRSAPRKENQPERPKRVRTSNGHKNRQKLI